MKRLIAVVLCAALLMAVLPLFSTAYAAEDEKMLDEIIIKFYGSSQFPGKEKQYGDEVAKVLKDGLSVVTDDVYVVKAEDLSKNPNAVLNKYKNSEFIEYVEPNYIGDFDAVPNDPQYTTLKALLTVLNAPAGWDIVKGGGPIVAVVDSGVYQHPDLPKLLTGYSAVAGLSPNNDKVGHGTGVAGTIGALGNNGTGTVGINWNATILPVKVDDANGTLSVANIAKGIMWAADNGAKIISLSVSTTSDSVTLKNAIDYAYNKGCAIFASTGNDGKNALNYPARYENVVAVGATAGGTSRAAISNYGTGMGVVAITSYQTTTASGGYVGMSGTSFSCPQVSGLASLVWAVNPGLSNADVYRMIQDGAKTLGGGYNIETGYGLIDIGKTLQLAKESIDGMQPPEPPNYDKPPVITLNGLPEMKTDVGDEYVEMGYSATDCLGKDLTATVSVSGAINVWTPGVYEIVYEVDDDGGNSARASRTVIIEEREIPLPPTEAPTLTIIGSNPIILHLGSGTPYTEQGALAIDEEDGDISHLVEISGSADTGMAGTYTLTYRVINSAGLEAIATREVRVLAPTTENTRMPYGFSGQAKQGNTFTHNNIISDMSGWTDLTVSNIDKNMTITVELINTANNEVVMSDTFNATGGKQYMIEEGAYEMRVAVDRASGNSKYEIKLLMPEIIHLTFDDEEVPLAGPDLLKDIISKGSTPLEICMRFKCQPEVLNEYYLDFIAAGWTKEDLGWFGLAEIFDNEAPLADSPQTGDAGPVNMILLFVVSLLGIGILLRLRKCLVRGR